MRDEPSCRRAGLRSASLLCPPQAEKEEEEELLRRQIGGRLRPPQAGGVLVLLPVPSRPGAKGEGRPMDPAMMSGDVSVTGSFVYIYI